VTFTATNGAPFAERKTVASGVTVNRYLRVTGDVPLGTAPSVTLLVGVERY
jgi:hypothetical protein